MSDFRLGNMATDLAEFTLDMCNKNEDGTLRFPKRMYESYVKRIIDLSLDILQGIFEVNAVHDDMQVRKERRELIVAHCLAMAKLVSIAYKKGWISDKQNTKWQKKINAIYYIVLRWQ